MTVTEEENSRPLLRRGPYLGEVSAICFLHLPPYMSSLPLLLAGTGSQIIVYDIATRKSIAFFQVFDGIRVHGITSEEFGQPLSHTSQAFRIAVYGERRVKLYNLCIRASLTSPSCFELGLTLIHSIPKFNHWILDACFLIFKDCSNSSTQRIPGLAVGCSDNSVCFWDIVSCNMVSQVKSTDRCLLYSMRMWNGKLDSLYVASGTIYNEIVVWKVNYQCHHSVSGLANGCGSDSIDVGGKPCGEQYCVAQVCRLIGHEGSIFQMAWSSDGLKLLSVSDDRSARVWTVNGDGLCNHDYFVSHSLGPVLFGHSARIWDCCMSDNLFITAGEDCTCRVWGLDGVEFKVIKEHTGRGVWRCLYDPISSLLVTAGFDSAIKVHQLNTPTAKSSKRCTNTQEDMNVKMEVFTIHLPNSLAHVRLLDSKSEYVRCLQFSCEDSFYVATNNGYLYHAFLSGNGEVKWTELFYVGEQAPIVCMDLLTDCSNVSDGIQHWVAVGDGKGNSTVVHIVGDIWSPKVKYVLTWPAEMERQLLGIYWCKSIGYRFIFTADPRGMLKLWRLCDPLAYISHLSRVSYNACLMSEFVSCFGLRIMCLDASFEAEVLVCGDIRGNLSLFPLSRSSSAVLNGASQEKVTPLNYFKGAHGISSMCSITIFSSCSTGVEICSTGQDGCICYFEHDRDQQSLDFISMKLVKELSTLQSVFCNSSCDDDTEYCQYAIGFASSDFAIWNLTAEAEVLKVSCGGWRRPHSYYIGNVPETQICFGFVKNEIIYIHRHWLHNIEPKVHPQNLNLQFHGREIHSICFVIRDLECNTEHGSPSKSCGIVTGCEDGSMRLTRYEPCFRNWSTSKLLGEHVGGSAVRSICCVSKMYTVMPNGIGSLKEELKDLENPFLLISVGAKKVVTAWKKKLKINNKRESSVGDPGIRVENRYPLSSCEALPSISFQWLSTDMPMKIRGHEKWQNREEGVEGSPGGSDFARNWNEVSKPQLAGGCENDWRYLAVTAFLVRVARSRFSVCFIVVACSDATITLRALLLPCQQWFDVAILAPSLSPVLAMKHIIVSRNAPFEDDLSVGDVYIVVTGSTDGSITFWDLTEAIENFVQQLSSLQLNDYFDCQKRPRTGRGSQGGRQWRSLGNEILKIKSGGGHTSDNNIKKGGADAAGKFGKTIESYVVHQQSEMLQSGQNADACSQAESRAFRVSEEAADTTISFDICEIEPLHILNNVHQSGVNCLYVSDTRDLSIAKERSTHYVLSGGDDQALSCLTFDISWKEGSYTDQDLNKDGCGTAPLEGTNDCILACQTQKYIMRFLLLDKIKSAHASAVKGVWTDGHWVFSTGLDQRVRCWILDQHGKLVEHSHILTSVPEPETLDVLSCDRNEYQIAVAGRGMQMVEFCAH